jgi:hypothetical protein
MQREVGSVNNLLDPKTQQLLPNKAAQRWSRCRRTVASGKRPQGLASPGILHLRHCHCRFAERLAVPQLLRRVRSDVVIPAGYSVRGLVDGVDQLAHQIVFGLCKAVITSNAINNRFGHSFGGAADCRASVPLTHCIVHGQLAASLGRDLLSGGILRCRSTGRPLQVRLSKCQAPTCRRRVQGWKQVKVKLQVLCTAIRLIGHSGHRTSCSPGFDNGAGG